MNGADTNHEFPLRASAIWCFSRDSFSSRTLISRSFSATASVIFCSSLEQVISQVRISTDRETNYVYFIINRCPGALSCGIYHSFEPAIVIFKWLQIIIFILNKLTGPLTRTILQRLTYVRWYINSHIAWKKTLFMITTKSHLLSTWSHYLFY